MAFFSNIFGSSSTGASDAPAPAPTTPAAPTTPPAPAVPESPMDEFKSLWEPVATPNVDTTLPANMFAGTDPAKMLEAARKVDFAKSIPPEVMSKITAGGPDAAAAFAQAMNDMSQRAYAQSSFAATKIVESALSKFQEGIESRLPGQVKKFQVSESLRESNPTLNHPAAAPIMEALQAQMSVKYPNASARELQDMAGSYLNAFTSAASPQKKADAIPEAENWGKFFQ